MSAATTHRSTFHQQPIRIIAPHQLSLPSDLIIPHYRVLAFALLRRFPMDASAFAQIDLLHWILDMNSLVSDAYRDVRKLCVFLLPVAASSFPPGKALTVYFQPLGHPFLFCDAVHPARTSSLLSLPWPDPSEEPPIPDPNPNPLQLALTSAKIGISVEDLASLPPVAYAVAEKKVERLALRVGENLFNFMQSFCGIDGSRLVVPMDILDRWFKKFQERARKDPSYLKDFAL
ncbi:uncharacterized protein LOC122004514 [Zingiber officinale]|uniref:uncharacterized protein LOC122004514 n=1 Tax=Zingiber officinale TaxID=94328 RepID=UPI001C4CC10E|nr:uncharacterized protein LOC122004514 [Zingiber officinale]